LKETYDVLNNDENCPICPKEFVEAIKFLWTKEPAIKRVYSRRNEYNLSKY